MFRNTKTYRVGKLAKFFHHREFKAYLEDAVLKIDEPLKTMKAYPYGSYDMQEMVHVNSTYVRDAIYDTLFEIRGKKLSPS